MDRHLLSSFRAFAGFLPMRETAILLMLAVLWTATSAWAVGSVDAVLAEAKAALDNGDATQARRLVDEELEQPDLQPVERARLLLDRGLASELMGFHDQALVDFTGAVNAKALPAAEQAQVLLQRGFLLDSMGRLSDALGDYTAAIGLAPDSAKAALNNRANIYRRQNRLKEARRDYLAALEGGTPRREYPYTGLGQIAEAQGDVEAARHYYTKAVAANAHYAMAVDRLAALGGPAPDSVDNLEVIHLRPPGAKSAAIDPPVELKPPPAPVSAAAPVSASGQGPIHLHMPRKTARRSPTLRPAISGDQSAGRLVQLGAWRSQAEAEAGWNRAKRRSGDALEGLANIIQIADLPGKGRYYRLRVAPGPFGARRLCEKLRASGLDCMVVTK
jgi:tetratricopeptide (TPR) repeat protein